jgi:hypothetical protein
MNRKILLAGLLGGLAIFLWEFVAHEVLPLGEAGLSALPDEAAVQAVVKQAVKEPGFYYFPAPQFQPGMTSDQKNQAMQKSMERAATEPMGMMIVYPHGRPFSFGGSLAIQFVSDVAVMLLCAALLSCASLGGYLTRVGFVTAMGLIPTMRVDLPYWNWYGFPTPYLLAQLTVHVVGFCLGGLILARLVKAGPK